jgi:hypothetical protein
VKKQSISKVLAIGLVAGWSVFAAPAFSGRAPANVVTGTVSGVNGNQITVDGKSYSIKLDGAALRELQHVQVGQAVDLVLNGPPKAAASQVVGIHVHDSQH